MKRDVNRGLIDPAMYRQQIDVPGSKRGLLRAFQSRATHIRAHERAFHPRGEQRVLTSSSSVFAVLRISPEGDRHVLALTNVTDTPVHLAIPRAELGSSETTWRDLLSDGVLEMSGDHLQLELQPYQVAWLQPASESEGGLGRSQPD